MTYFVLLVMDLSGEQNFTDLSKVQLNSDEVHDTGTTHTAHYL